LGTASDVNGCHPLVRPRAATSSWRFMLSLPRAY